MSWSRLGAMRFCGTPLVQVTRSRSGGVDLAEAEVDDAAVGLAELVGVAGLDLDRGAEPEEVDLVVALGERLEAHVEPVVLVAADVVEAVEAGRAGGDQVEVAVAIEVGGGERRRRRRASHRRWRAGRRRGEGWVRTTRPSAPAAARSSRPSLSASSASTDVERARRGRKVAGRLPGLEDAARGCARA